MKHPGISPTGSRTTQTRGRTGSPREATACMGPTGKPLISHPTAPSPGGFPLARPSEKPRPRGPFAAAARSRGEGMQAVSRVWRGRGHRAHSPAPARQPAAIGLTRNIHSPCERTHKTLLRGTQRPKIGRLEHSNIIEMSVLSNLGYKFNVILIKIPANIFLRSQH